MARPGPAHEGSPQQQGRRHREARVVEEADRAGSRRRAAAPCARTRCPGAARTASRWRGSGAGAASSAGSCGRRAGAVNSPSAWTRRPPRTFTRRRRPRRCTMAAAARTAARTEVAHDASSPRRIAARRTVALAAAAAVAAPASGWPGWRGPNRDGLSTETGLLRAWPAAGPAAGLEGLRPRHRLLERVGGRRPRVHHGRRRRRPARDRALRRRRQEALVGEGRARRGWTSTAARAARPPWTATSSTRSAPRATSSPSRPPRARSAGGRACPATSADG